jgi:folate-binding protein YgfZ
MIRLDHLAAVRCFGADAQAFLHNQFSADIESLEPGESTFACYCNPKGRVIALLLVCRLHADTDGHYLLVTSGELLDRVVSRLKMFVLRDRVEWESASAQVVFGREAESSGGAMPSAHQGGLTLLRHLPFGDYLSGGTGEVRDGADDPSRRRAWQADEIEHGIAWLDEAGSEQYLPQMLGAEAIGALSFTKGCYPGQEIVARARYLGKVKRRPQRVTIEGAKDLPTGRTVKLIGPGMEADVSVAAASPGADGKWRALLIGAYDEDSAIESVEVDDERWPAERIAVQRSATT